MIDARSTRPPAVLSRVSRKDISSFKKKFLLQQIIMNDAMKLLNFLFFLFFKFTLLSSGDSSVNSDFPNKMAQLAAICKIELDQESV